MCYWWRQFLPSDAEVLDTSYTLEEDEKEYNAPTSVNAPRDDERDQSDVAMHGAAIAFQLEQDAEKERQERIAQARSDNLKKARAKKKENQEKEDEDDA